ncbi:MAG TPA: copper-binding protein [Candidatus Binatia bacterium]|nr:copper-binding protein [Candidatus Binatia bacterium]
MSRHFYLASAMALLYLLAAMTTNEAAERGETKSVESHHHPRNWRFTMPKGNAANGRAVFEKFACFDCHRIRGESFPEPTYNDGPELSQMGPLHPLEYFTESVLHPDALVPRNLRDRDGKSPMSKEHLDRMTLRELIDLSSYLASLKPPTTAKTVTGVGKVVALVPQSRELVIDHEEIKEFMDAMTMGYKVSSPALLKSLKPGDKIRFTVDTQRREITKIELFKN